jgi:hypothetical protein
MGHITYDRTDTLRQSARCDSLLKPFDARRMPVDCHNGTRRKFSEMEGLSADTASQVEDRGEFCQLAAKTKGFDGAIAIAGTLTGQVLENLEKDFPEAGAGVVHEYSSFSSARTPELSRATKWRRLE